MTDWASSLFPCVCVRSWSHFVLVMIAGGVAFTRLNIEAYPDPVPPLVDIVTQNPGQSAEEIERYITIPVEMGVATSPYLSAMRSISLFGLSDLKLQFTYDLTYEEAEQKVLNRLRRQGGAGLVNCRASTFRPPLHRAQERPR
jgi:multidrug efflux pump subunit AcrB